MAHIHRAKTMAMTMLASMGRERKTADTQACKGWVGGKWVGGKWVGGGVGGGGRSRWQATALPHGAKRCLTGLGAASGAGRFDWLAVWLAG